MATRSLICHYENDCYNVIYCHWDGYPEHNGLILKRYYKNEEKIRKLIGLGDLSCLREEIGENHKHNDLSKGNWVIAYHRDLGEEYTSPRKCENTNELIDIADSMDADYIYIFKDGEWKYYNCKMIQI